MKLTYAIAFEDFKTLQPPFTRGGSNLGFKGVLFACGLMGLLGVFCLVKGMGLPVGLFLIGLGAGAAVAWLLLRATFCPCKGESVQEKAGERLSTNPLPRAKAAADSNDRQPPPTLFRTSCVCTLARKACTCTIGQARRELRGSNLSATWKAAT